DVSKVIQGIESISQSNQANVINLSLDGVGTCPQSLQNSINSAVEKNITVVVAAGNEHSDSAGYFPANCQNVIAVGALGPNSERARYSNYGSLIDVAAPGGNPNVPSGSSYDCNTNGTDCIISTWLSNEYALSAGTSMAAPHVAGLVALMLGKNSSLTPAQIETILKDTGTTISTDQPMGKLINAQAALLAINTGDPTPTPTGTGNTPTPSPTNAAAATPTPTGIILPPNNPTPTRMDNICPAVCGEGDANCNNIIDNEDYNIWKTQFDKYRIGEQLEGTARTGDLDCSLNNAASPGYVTLADFEIWRKHSFVVNPGTACGTSGTIEGESYETLSINGSPETRAILEHPDYNIALRGWEAVPNARKEIYDMGQSADPDPNTPPQLKGLFADNRIPQVSGTYQMYNWNWGSGDNIGSKGGLYSSPPEVQLLGAAVTKGEVLKVPDSGYQIASGYEVMVLYADDNSIMLSYKSEDTAATGYLLHVLDICVEPRLLALYTASNQGSGARVSLPALRAGQAFGRSKETEVKFTVRDTGSFMEPRNTQNWWR
ncbi:MAG: S8 family serine peptidase, partial [bacterium]|nr:S8 family serine peptidase [bacterium]